jgi:hypothetical protein
MRIWKRNRGAGRVEGFSYDQGQLLLQAYLRGAVVTYTCRVGRVASWAWPMDQKEVDISGVEGGENGVKLIQGILVAQCVERSNFGGDEDVFSRHLAALDANANRDLVSIGK